jgi:predicted nucleic acid-binding protein
VIFVDSNVILDVFDGTGEWAVWSTKMLGEHYRTSLFINHIIVAEVGTRFQGQAELETVLDLLGLAVLDFSMDASWMASKAHLKWIKNGGRRGAMLADILIGAHAVTQNATVMTRDPRRFKTYFPELNLITPETK